MKILALDLGRKLGWAVWCENRLCCGVHELAPKGAGLYGVTHAFTLWLKEKLEGASTQVVAYERPYRQHRHVRGAAATEILLGMSGIVAGLAQEAGASVRSYATVTLKARVAGHGRASKDAMKRAASYFWGDRLVAMALHDPEHPETMDDNMADSLAVLLCALWDLDPAWTPAVELKL